MNIQLKDPMTFEDAEIFLSDQSVQRIAYKDHIAWSLKVSIEYSMLRIPRDKRLPTDLVPSYVASFLLELAKRVRDALRPKPKLVFSNEFWPTPVGGIEKLRPKLTLASSK